MGVEAALIGSSLIGAGSSMSAASKANKANKSNLKQGKAAALQIDERLMPILARGEQLTRKSAAELTSGMDAAEAQVTRGASAGQRSLADAAKQARMGAAQGMTNRGIAGTTIGQQAAQGADRAYARDMADFQAQIGGLYADIARQRAAAKSGAYDKMAQFQAYKGEAMQAGPRAMLGLVGNTSFQAQPGMDMSGLGALLAMYGNKGGGYASSPQGLALANSQAWQSFNNFSGTGLGSMF